MNKIAPWLLLCLTISLCAITVVGNHGLLELLKMLKEIKVLEVKNSELESEIIQLRNKKFAINHSDPTLEKSAREELGLSKPGEIIYIFPRSVTE
jgi:cell division protein FtsB